MDLFGRIKSILFTPDSEWKIIEPEPGNPSYLFKYVAFLAAIPVVAGFIGFSVIGISVPVVGTIRVPIFSGIMNAIFGYILAFVVVYVVAIITDMLAPTFAGEKNFPNALKLVVYSYTPAWIAGVFLMIPGLGFLTILGLYGLYLLWKGIPLLMKSPPEKALGYAAAVVVCAALISILLNVVLGNLFRAGI